MKTLLEYLTEELTENDKRTEVGSGMFSRVYDVPLHSDRVNKVVGFQGEHDPSYHFYRGLSNVGDNPFLPKIFHFHEMRHPTRNHKIGVVQMERLHPLQNFSGEELHGALKIAGAHKFLERNQGGNPVDHLVNYTHEMLNHWEDEHVRMSTTNQKFADAIIHIRNSMDRSRGHPKGFKPEYDVNEWNIMARHTVDGPVPVLHDVLAYHPPNPQYYPIHWGKE